MLGFRPKKYVKDESFDPIYKSASPKFYFKSQVLPALLMTLGVITLGTQVIFPLISFETSDEVTKPMASTVLGVVAGFGEFEYKELKNTADAAITPESKNQTDPNGYFYLSIPKLGINNAKVKANSTDLSPDKALGHYNGSAMPGETGNSFIYGHSVLPWFYNPRNYKTIFSTLDRLKPKDEILITYNNKEYKYLVETLEILDPENVAPLAEFKPGYLNESTLTLLTCWPAGTKAKRLLVRAVLF